MSKLRELFFKDFIKLNRGFDLPEDKIIPGAYPIAVSTSIKGYHHQYKVKAPCVTTGRSGSLGTVLYINENCWPHNTCLYVKDFKGNHPRYVFYFLQMMKLANFNAGAGVPTLNQNHLHNLKLKIHSIKEQPGIADILSSYDDLIDANNKRIALLEQMAEQIYKEWFVRMRFPGYENTEFEKGVPKWQILRLNKIAYFTKGKNPKTLFTENREGAYLYLNVESLEGSTETYCENENGIIVNDGETIMLMDGARSGLLFKARKGILGSTMSVIRPKPNYKEYHTFIFFFLQSNFDWIASNNVGSAIPHANRKFIEKMNLFLPSKILVEKFNLIVNPIRDQVEVLKSENKILKQTRDLLLPRLISGKLRVKELINQGRGLQLN